MADSLSRRYLLAAAQLGPIARDEPRASAVARMQALMVEAHRRGARVLAEIDLDRCAEIRRNIFNFALHRRPADYTAIVDPS